MFNKGKQITLLIFTSSDMNLIDPSLSMSLHKSVQALLYMYIIGYNETK